MSKIYELSDGSLVDRTKHYLGLHSNLPSKVHIEVPNGWHVVFSNLTNTLTAEPLVGASRLELESRVNSLEKKTT